MSDSKGSIVDAAVAWCREWRAGWNQFWFTPELPYTWALIRFFTGVMAAYVHLIWLSSIHDFMGPHAWVNADTIRQLHAEDWAWSWLWYVESPTLLAIHQLVAIIASLALAIGFATRLAAIVSWWLMLMVCHRMTLALFGLDQVVAMLLMYLLVSDAGGAWSVDARLRSRVGTSWWNARGGATTANRIATRLVQLHLCVIYLFGGLSKMRGEMWFDGSALWYTLVNYEYQSLDLVWLGRYPWLISLLTLTTLFWETYYCALIWPRLTRPITLAMAVFVHGGIAIALGMPTFGWIMIVANLAFIDPAFTRRLATRLARGVTAWFGYQTAQ